jgi:uncharacterized protein (TIGR02145 family)
MTVLLCSPVVLSAQNGVSVSNLNVNTGTVTFDVRWGDQPLPDVWVDSVWVFVDYNDNGTMKRLELLPGATLTNPSWSGASITLPDNNNQGAWVAGNARSAIAGSFSATVKLLTATADVTGACAYASNYPPVAEYLASQTIKFTGTPPYNLVLNSGATTTAYSDYNLLPGQALMSFTDKTGAPGIMKCIAPATFTLSASASVFCAGDATGVAFTLDGTESGRKYRLYRNGTAVNGEITGDGNGVTLGTFAVAGTYTALTVADGLYCAIAMSGAPVVNENPLPADPDVNNASRDCPGTVTLSASSSGAEIDWYADAAATSMLHNGESYDTPVIYTSTTYYVQARVDSSGCLSAQVVPITADVIMEGCCHEPGAPGITFANFNPCPCSYTSAWTITDLRDQNTYTVSIKEDSRIWFDTVLNFGDKCDSLSYGWTKTLRQGAIDSNFPEIYGDCRRYKSKPNATLYDAAALLNTPAAYGTSPVKCHYNKTTGDLCPGLCPLGWHHPSYAEYTTLINALRPYYEKYTINTHIGSNPNGALADDHTSIYMYWGEYWRLLPETSGLNKATYQRVVLHVDNHRASEEGNIMTFTHCLKNY